MNKPKFPPPLPLLDSALDNVRRMGLVANILQREPALGRSRADALVRIGRGGEGDAVYAAEVKNVVHPANMGATLLELERLGQQALLITEHVTPELAEQLKARQVAFIDASGNAYLQQPELLIWVSGRKRVVDATAPAGNRAFQPTGLQVVFALLCNPASVHLPYRDLAGMAGVAHGTVGWAMPDLQQQGYVADRKGKRGTRRLFNTTRLLGQWTDAYARVLRPRTLIGRYYVPTIADWKEWPIADIDTLWGGEPAGAKLTDHLRPGELTLYAPALPAALAMRKKFKSEPEPGHTAVVEVRRRFWNFPGDAHHTDVVPPLLAYADLLATGDARCIETAKLVYQGYLERLLAQP